MNKLKTHFRDASFISWIIIGLVLFIVFYQQRRWEERRIIDNDIINYYAYLPASFIHHDVSLEFIDEDTIDYAAEKKFWPLQAPNGGKVMKYSMGMAYMYTPFFFIAHIDAKTKGYPTDGFSKPYQLLIAMSGVVYAILGLFFLRKVLRRFFNPWTVAIVLTGLVFGTNLFYYSFDEGAMPHAASFFVISLFLLLSIKWYERPKLITAIGIGLVGGLMVLIRPVNILVFLFPLLYGVTGKNTAVERLNLLLAKRKHLLLLIIAAFIVWIPQLIYWKSITGHWLFYSYIDEGFYFSSPHIMDGLFSFRKGWLIYTPLMIFFFLGLIPLYKKRKGLFLPLSIFTIVYSYVVFSWWCWWYGGSFGMRAMIDGYPLFAIGLCTFITWIFQRSYIWKSLIALSFAFLLYLNIFQTKQYQIALIHWDSMTKKAYFTIFLEKEYPKNYSTLIAAPDYEKAKKGIDEY